MIYDRRPTVIITPGQRQILDELLRTGGSNEEIGKALFVSPHTVKSQLAELMKRLGTKTRTELVVRVMRDQFIIGIARQHKPPRRRSKAVEAVHEG